ncbi:DUF2510 domain-containing protein [Schaalia vaccimaxillae]|uniref:DUF2510 domain-containing protein n=1 Tax=Schaalia vaccimaxillae TaxID=183916 RepID=UPI0003B513D3|nr:DUF2510 domain-containing protein [Schaalia vaccimaxillae]
MSTPIQGWYPDPAGSGRLRWWDGTTWTDHLRDLPSQAAGSPSSPASARPKARTSMIVSTVIIWVGAFIFACTALATFVGSVALPQAVEDERSLVDQEKTNLKNAQTDLEIIREQLEELR